MRKFFAASTLMLLATFFISKSGLALLAFLLMGVVWLLMTPFLPSASEG